MQVFQFLRVILHLLLDSAKSDDAKLIDNFILKFVLLFIYDKYTSYFVV